MLSEVSRLVLLPVSAGVGVGRRLRDVSLELAGDAALSALDAVLDRAITQGVPQRIADRLLEDGLAEQLAQRFLDGPELERMVALVLESERVDAALVSALESADMERLIIRIVESRLIDETVTRLAQSPAVTDAIAQQGLGLADEVADEVRDRSRAADAWLERAAGRMLRRRTRPEPFAP
jgi:hypothetical protein